MSQNRPNKLGTSDLKTDNPYALANNSTLFTKTYSIKTLLAFIFIQINNFSTLSERPPPSFELVKSKLLH